MRLALLGPADGNRTALRSRAQFALDRLSPDRVMYLGVDDIFDDVLLQWAREIVMGDPSDAAVWDRAVQACATADHRAIDVFLRRERQRTSLRKVTCLPHAKARTVELFSGIVTVIIHDKALLDEEDILPAALLVFGKARDPIIHRVGQRTFISPGPLAHPKGGVALLAEEAGEIAVSIYDSKGDRVRQETVASLARGTRLTVQGADP